MTFRTALCDVLGIFPMYAGHSAGLIHDLPGAGEVVENVIREARAVLASLESRVRTR